MGLVTWKDPPADSHEWVVSHAYIGEVYAGCIIRLPVDSGDYEPDYDSLLSDWFETHESRFASTPDLAELRARFEQAAVHMAKRLGFVKIEWVFDDWIFMKYAPDLVISLAKAGINGTVWPALAYRIGQADKTWAVEYRNLMGETIGRVERESLT